MSRVALVNPWGASTLRRSTFGPTKGAKVVLIWFGLCVTAATVGMTLTAEVPSNRAHTLVATAQ